MPDYNKSVIYKLYDNTNGDTYYGSTCNELRYRIYQHKHATNNTKSKSIILNDDYSYSVVEEFPCETKLELHTRERWWIENNKCVNKVIPTRTKKEYNDIHKDEIRKRGIERRKLPENRDKQKERRDKQSNKDYMKDYRVEYVNKNKEYFKNYFAEYNIKNKEEISKKRATKIICECGFKISSRNIATHRKSARHIKLMSCLSCPPCLPCPPSPL